jgi:hypothetical protein
MRRVLPATFALVLAAILCLIPLQACEQDTEARISFDNQTWMVQTFPQVRIVWDSTTLFGHRTNTAELDHEKFHAGPYSTAQSGTIRLHFTLLKDGIATATTGEIELGLRKDWGWGVDFIVGNEDPASSCFGCFGSTEFELDPALGYSPDMKLYVSWGGNSISNPVIY